MFVLGFCHELVTDAIIRQQIARRIIVNTSSTHRVVVAHLQRLPLGVQDAALPGGDQERRLDHPDLEQVSREVRKRLDARGMKHTKILGSGQLNALNIRSLLDNKAPIDLFAVGGALTEGIATGGPPLCYRMAALVRGTTPSPINGHWSAYWPGIKQVIRHQGSDIICAEVEVPDHLTEKEQPLLKGWVVSGERALQPQSLRESRVHRAMSVVKLPTGVRRLIAPDDYEVQPSSTVRRWRNAEPSA